MKIILCEISNGVLTGQKKEIEESDFKLDLKQCGKTYMKDGVKVFVDSIYFNTIK